MTKSETGINEIILIFVTEYDDDTTIIRQIFVDEAQTATKIRFADSEDNWNSNFFVDLHSYWTVFLE